MGRLLKLVARFMYLHMDVPMLANQQELTSAQCRYMMYFGGTDGEKESGEIYAVSMI